MAYKMIIWGPSTLGKTCIREILRRPEFQLVGVYTFSESKSGQDVGTLLGLDAPIGVKATNNKAEILALDADCVLYTAAPPFDLDAMENDVISLLESGKNVVSSTSFFYHAYQGKERVARVEAACRKGNASLHGTGVNPGFIMERLGVTLTALTMDVENIKVIEAVYCGDVPNETMAAYGMGVSEEQARQGPVFGLMSRWGYPEAIMLTSKAIFGRVPDSVEYSPIYEAATEDIHKESITIKKGTSKTVRHIYNAKLDGETRFSFEMVWYTCHEDAPYRDSPGFDDRWVVEIEGKPTSLRLSLEAMHSVKKNMLFAEGDKTLPAYYVTSSILLQATPIVCAAEPGIVYASVFTNATDDVRRLVGRKSMNG